MCFSNLKKAYQIPGILPRVGLAHFVNNFCSRRFLLRFLFLEVSQFLRFFFENWRSSILWSARWAAMPLRKQTRRIMGEHLSVTFRSDWLQVYAREKGSGSNLFFFLNSVFWGESMLIANQMIFQGVVVVVVVVVTCCVVIWHISFQRQSTPCSQECGINSFTNGTACFCVLKGGKTWRTEGSECFTDERLEAQEWYDWKFRILSSSLLLQIFCRGFCGKQTELQILPWSFGVGSSPRDLPTRPIWNSLWSEHGTFPTESLHLYKLTNSFMTCQHPSYIWRIVRINKNWENHTLACLFLSKNYWRSDLAFGLRCISTSIFQGKPLKTRPFPTKKRVI